MKTKTIYHLDQDCNIVRIEVITKSKEKKKRPITINIERLIEVRQMELTHDKQNLEILFNHFGGRESLLSVSSGCIRKSLISL